MKDKRKNSSSAHSNHSANLLMQLKIPSMTNSLQQAVFRGCVECIQVLVETPPYFSVDSACGPEGLRPIHIAAREGHINTLRYLTNAGACILNPDFHGLSALHHASIGGQLRAVRWLLRHGAELTLDKRGISPIQVAADNDHMEIVTLLAKHTSCGSSTNLIIPSSSCTSGPTPLCTIVSTNNNHNHHSRRSSSGSPSTTTTIVAGSIHKKNYHHTTARTTPGSNKIYEQQNPSSVHNHNHNVNRQSQSQNNNHDKTELSPSSSGNSSLATISSPSLSPSSATTSCTSCLSSSESSSSSSSSAEDKSGLGSCSEDVDVYCVENNGRSCCNKDSSGAAVITPPFFLHPPKSSISSRTGAHNHHKRQSSFYLHPPSSTDTSIVESSALTTTTTCSSVVHFADEDNSDIEIQEVNLACNSSSNSSSHCNTINGDMAPVTPNSATDFIPSKGEHRHLKSGSNSSSPSPPPPPPPLPKSSKLPIRNGNGIGASTAKVARKGLAPPPPPPPPMPKFDDQAATTTTTTMSNGNSSNHAATNGFKNDNASSSPTSNEAYSANGEEENDYEDIDEIQNCLSSDELRKTVDKRLNRSISAPAGNPSNSNCNGDATEIKEKAQPNENEPKIPSHIAISAKMFGIDRVPFIPPSFPDPPKDALIKPSEYLKSIQQNKCKTGNYGVNGSSSSSTNSTSNTPSPTPISKVEECIKTLNGGTGSDNMGMTTVLEETSVEDDQDQDVDRFMNGNGVGGETINGNGVSGFDRLKNGQNGHHDENSKNAQNGNHCGNGIKSEELSKVNLRKTPTSRTVSAPMLGRVLPEKPTENLYIESYNNKSNGQPTYNSSTLSTAIIAELSESSQVGGVREWKEELRRRHVEMEKAAVKELDQVYSPLNFVAEVPSSDVTGVPIPPWKRQMLAKKFAEKARKEAEEQRKLEAEAKRVASIPPWRRQLLQRRESTTEGKYS